jgi:hypothetical protein
MSGVVPDDLDGPIREHLGWDEAADYEDLRVIERGRVREAAVNAVALLHQQERQERERRQLIRGLIGTHERCQLIIDDLIEECDDLLAGIQEARRLCRYESFEGEYGDRLISAEKVREALAPRKSATHKGRSLDDEEERCPVCTGGYVPGDHDEDCPVPKQKERAEERLRNEIASHGCCLTFVDGLLAEIDKASAQVESAVLATETQLWSPDYYGEGGVLETGAMLVALAALPTRGGCKSARRPTDA